MGNVTRVQAKAITALHHIEVEDTVVATLEFSNEAIGTLAAATSVYPGYTSRIELTGSEGTIIVEGDRIIRADPPTPLDSQPWSATDESQIRASSPVVSEVGGHRRLLKISSLRSKLTVALFVTDAKVAGV